MFWESWDKLGDWVICPECITPDELDSIAEGGPLETFEAEVGGRLICEEIDALGQTSGLGDQRGSVRERHLAMHSPRGVRWQMMETTRTSAHGHTVTILECLAEHGSGRSDFSAMCLDCWWIGLSRDNPDRAERDAQTHGRRAANGEPTAARTDAVRD